MYLSRQEGLIGSWGKTEVHGGWFARVLAKVIEERGPSTKEEWLECVVQSHVKNQMIQNHGFTPSQRVFGKNPDLPGDLLSEPVSTVPSTVSLQDEAIAKSYEVRNAARRAVPVSSGRSNPSQSLASSPSARQAVHSR